MKVFYFMLLLVATANLSHAAGFSVEERQALLDYTRQSLVSRLARTSPPRAEAPILLRQRACFVTFFKNRSVLACFGSFSPRKATLAEEISENIRLALKNDARALHLTPELARRIEIQLTFPEQPQPTSDWRTINPVTEGLLVEAPDGRGVAIVPGEARTARYAWRSALQRLGLHERSSGVRLYLFRAQYVREGQ